MKAAGRLNRVCTLPYTPKRIPAACSENPAAASRLWQIPGSRELRIAKIHSYSGFQIGDYKTSRMNIILAVIGGLDKEHENLINGQSVGSLEYTGEKEYSKYIKVVSVNCERK